VLLMVVVRSSEVVAETVAKARAAQATFRVTVAPGFRLSFFPTAHCGRGVCLIGIEGPPSSSSPSRQEIGCRFTLAFDRLL